MFVSGKVLCEQETMTRHAVWSFMVVGLLFGSASGQEESAPAIQKGRELAEKMCAACHNVAGGQPKAVSDAPSFQSMADGQRADPGSLRAFLNTTQANVSHAGAMPNPRLRNDEIDEISAYIHSLGTH
jgi:mono/diheme cytochrome c family protein